MDATLAGSLVGRMLDGRYRVESRIARGGMATVYVATDTRLDRTVALKIMHKELASDADFVRRFIGEAKSVARLSHPNVVAVFDQGSDGENLYLAMEYVPGHTLRDLLNERGRLSPGEALDIMVSVLAGLGAAHQAGLVHRDVKPENVLLGEGRVKVVDFGLARAVAEARQTKTGMVIGTVAYLAPEQVSRSTADARTDVYAAGVMLFELVTGRQPFTGESPLEVAYQHVNETVPPPSSVAGRVPAAIDSLVALATSRDPWRRPGDASQLLRAVYDARGQLPGATAFAGSPGAQSAQAFTPRHSGPAPYPGPPQAGPSPHPGAVPYSGPPQPGPPQIPSPPEDGIAGPPSMILGVPGVPGVTALPSFGPGPQGGGPGTSVAPFQGGTGTGVSPRQNNTLIVTRPPGSHALRDRGLGRWLFSRRLAYLGGGLAVVVLVSLIAWWQTAGRYTIVPNVAGLTTSTAATELRNVGFKVKIGPAQTDNSVPKGEVARTQPRIGSQAPNGSVITLIPSAGPRMIAVPNVTGKGLADARKALQAAGLIPGVASQQTSDTVPVGQVISTDPPPGTSWPQTRAVKLTVSAGVGLPNFVGQPKQVAEQWLAQHQLQVQEQPVNSATVPTDAVVKQSPAANTPISPGQVVSLEVSAGPAMIPIPDVTGQPVHDAVKQLEKLGFQVNVIGFKGGHVMAFNPTGQAPQGSTITIVAGP
jgi:eukaryotic-like serine/threonine-protein kinase